MQLSDSILHIYERPLLVSQENGSHYEQEITEKQLPLSYFEHPPDTYHIAAQSQSSSTTMSSDNGEVIHSDAMKNPARFFNDTASIYDEATGGATIELARLLLQQPELQLPADAVVHDNAAGTGAVLQEVVRARGGAPLPRIFATDTGPDLLDLARAKIAGLPPAAAERISVEVMDAHKLGYADETFTHSFTHFSLPFFSDPAAGVREIHRTLRPGGVAVVTTWAEIGFLDKVINPALKAVRSGATDFRMPVSPEWLQASHMEKVLRAGGFEDVRMKELVGYRCSRDAAVLSSALVGMTGALTADWPADEKRALEEKIASLVHDVAEKHTMVNGEDGVGIPSAAVVAIAGK